MTSDLPEKDGGGFVFENDSVSIQYDFLSSSELQVRIRNKLSELIHLDLSKSALISEGMATSLYSGNVKFSGYSSSGSFIGKANGAPFLLHIPPKSEITHVIRLKNLGFRKDLVLSKEYEDIKLGYNKAKEFKFSQGDSTGLFKPFLFVNNSDESLPQSFQYSFWVGKIVMTNYTFPVNSTSQFVNSEPVGAAKAVIVAGAIGLAVGYIVLESKYPDEDE